MKAHDDEKSSFVACHQAYSVKLRTFLSSSSAVFYVFHSEFLNFLVKQHRKLICRGLPVLSYLPLSFKRNPKICKSCEHEMKVFQSLNKEHQWKYRLTVLRHVSILWRHAKWLKKTCETSEKRERKAHIHLFSYDPDILGLKIFWAWNVETGPLLSVIEVLFKKYCWNSSQTFAEELWLKRKNYWIDTVSQQTKTSCQILR